MAKDTGPIELRPRAAIAQRKLSAEADQYVVAAVRDDAAGCLAEGVRVAALAQREERVQPRQEAVARLDDPGAQPAQRGLQVLRGFKDLFAVLRGIVRVVVDEPRLDQTVPIPVDAGDEADQNSSKA